MLTPSDESIVENARLPFFIYGTLLPDQPNYPVWGDAILRLQPATLRGGVLYDLGNFPMLVEHGDGTVTGRLVDIQPELYTAVLAQLDALEGFDHSRPHDAIYRRVVRRVYGPDAQAATAWVYIGRPQQVQGMEPLADGDWARYSAAKLTHMAQWWATYGRNLLDQPTLYWTIAFQK